MTRLTWRAKQRGDGLRNHAQRRVGCKPEFNESAKMVFWGKLRSGWINEAIVDKLYRKLAEVAVQGNEQAIEM